MQDRIRVYYRKDLDELRVFDTIKEESIVYIQGYSRRYPVPTNERPSTETLVLLSVRYPEIKEVM